MFKFQFNDMTVDNMAYNLKNQQKHTNLHKKHLFPKLFMASQQPHEDEDGFMFGRPPQVYVMVSSTLQIYVIQPEHDIVYSYERVYLFAA